jgi:hypothetical protein
MLKVCFELQAKKILIPELSEIYYGIKLVLCIELLLNEARFFIDEKTFIGKKIPFKKITIISKSDIIIKQVGNSL